MIYSHPLRRCTFVAVKFGLPLLKDGAFKIVIAMVTNMDDGGKHPEPVTAASGQKESTRSTVSCDLWR